MQARRSSTPANPHGSMGIGKCGHASPTCPCTRARSVPVSKISGVKTKFLNRVAETKWDDLRTVKSTIFRVPKHLRDNDPHSYDPVYISLGPYHRREERLQAMHYLKWHCLKKFLDLDHDKTLVDYLKLMKKLESQARNAYSEDTVDMNSDDFALMLLLDGCFVIWTIKCHRMTDGGLEDVQNPIESTSWAPPAVAQDMLTLENQLNSNDFPTWKEGELEEAQNPIKSTPWALSMVARDMLDSGKPTSSLYP
ncbi:hypothetical protein Cni_G15135 [Canna indica]|uniref:Uncharacterized protein n=1 Tax=Canna indica TaxID=4628 RepID=A0AAQ3KJ14_9LILI|nr:hypothetical protein Cni_G15135 [Canna indica]